MTVTVEQGSTAPFPNAGYKRPVSGGFTKSLRLQDILFAPSTPGETQLILPRSKLLFLCYTVPAKDEMGRPAYSTNSYQLTLDDYRTLNYYPESLITRLTTTPLKDSLTSPPPLHLPVPKPPSFTKKEHNLLKGTFTESQLQSLLLALLANSQRFYVSVTVKLPKTVEPLSIVYALLKLVPTPLRVFSWSTCRNGVFSPEQPHTLICMSDVSLSIRYDQLSASYPASLQFLTRRLLSAPLVTRGLFTKLYNELPPQLATYYAPIEYMADSTVDKPLMKWLIQQYLSVSLYSRVAKYATLLESLQ